MSAPWRRCREERAPGGPGAGPPASASGVQTSVQASPQLPSWEGVAFVLQAAIARRGGGAAALGLAAGWRASPLLPWFPPSLPDLAAAPTLLPHRGFLFCLSLGACGVFPARSQAVEASSLFLQLPPALSTSGRLHTPFPEPARVQGRCQHCGPALPFAPSSCPLRRLASALGGRRPGPCPLPLVLLGLRRRF